MAKDNGWSGIIINGLVRDIEILKDIDIGVMALGSCPRKSEKKNIGERNSRNQYQWHRHQSWKLVLCR